MALPENADRPVIRISVRDLVGFLLRGGDIDRGGGGFRDPEAMLEGSRVHRMIQKRQGGDYRAEVPLRRVYPLLCADLLLEGRADGLFSENGLVWVDEIKGMYRDIFFLEDPVPIHEAQAKCYAAMIAQEEGLPRIGVQMTYCSLETKQVRLFRKEYAAEELTAWLAELISEYEKWVIWSVEHTARRTAGLKALLFPYPYREGQKGLAVSVYQAVAAGKHLFIQAPTGIGKTLAVLFPAMKAMGEGLGDKIFYLTAKTVTRTVAEETLRLLRGSGLSFTSVTLTAREKICPMETCECRPEVCPYAKGHFDRVREAVYTALQEKEEFDRETVLSYAERFTVCPFELSLDISSWTDAVICDYNYAFDPTARLRRFFAEGESGDYIFLIDEAHNLVDRAREMYSAVLVKERVLEAKRLVKGERKALTAGLEKLNRLLLARKRECPEKGQVLSEIHDVVLAAAGVLGQLQKILEEEKKPLPDPVMDLYFDLRTFTDVGAVMDETYRIYADFNDEGEFFIKLLNIVPARRLSEQLDKGRSAVFFSATLLPVNYYKELLTGDAQDTAVYAESPFPRENRLLRLGLDVSSRYKRRSPEEFRKIWRYIREMAETRKGNYLAFFPSYAFLDGVAVQAELNPPAGCRILVQHPSMREEEKEAFLTSFEEEGEETVLGLCVIGGSFSEGIDLTGGRLIGAAIIGPGLPMVCTEREILRTYFDEQGRDGFAYAYTYPGMNKVLQAAGRVIRTDTDRGVILLLDERFGYGTYRRLFPREWEDAGPVRLTQLKETLRRFWEEGT